MHSWLMQTEYISYFRNRREVINVSNNNNKIERKQNQVTSTSLITNKTRNNNTKKFKLTKKLFL